MFWKTKLIKIVIIFIFVWISFPDSIFASETSSFVTPVNPIRNRILWGDINLLDKQINFFKTRNLSATWLLQYDTLADGEIVGRLKEMKHQELGIWMEVSENLATDSEVPYLLGDGDWARPDKVFFSGYEPEERKRMADTVFESFKRTFGFYPNSVAAWYLDATTLNYLVQKYHILVALDCSDQYSTDKYELWGQPWDIPFYPSKYNSLIPAQTDANKLGLLMMQWPMRDPKLAYGRTAFDSTYSLQANDYQGHHQLGIDFFNKILDIYLKTNNRFSQATIGIEVGQEPKFLPEYENQVESVFTRKENQEIKVLTLSEFAKWYSNKFTHLSPQATIKSGDTSWYFSPQKRVGLDTRNYDDTYLEKDLVSADKNKILYRVVPNKMEYSGIRSVKKTISKIIFGLSKLPLPKYYPLPIRFSQFGGQRIVGLQVNKTKLLGIKFPHFSFGIFEYPFQTLVRFKTWPDINLLSKIFVSDSQLQLEELLANNSFKDLTIFKREEVDVSMMEKFEKEGRKLVLDNSEYQVWKVR